MASSSTSLGIGNLRQVWLKKILFKIINFLKDLLKYGQIEN